MNYSGDNGDKGIGGEEVETVVCFFEILKIFMKIRKYANKSQWGANPSHENSMGKVWVH